MADELDQVKLECLISSKLHSMKLNFSMKKLSNLGRWIATSVFCLSAIAFVWQGAFFANTSAMADTSTYLIATADATDSLREKSKEFIRDTKNNVKEAARTNASRVDDATDRGSAAERKANKDASRIQKRAEEDAARTETAVDKNLNAVERTIDNIKGAFTNN
ncbi:conserved hypothetical protein [Trichormus variabilis ATCC 29413]|uniref:Uncharacterized protein n=2 Tax=Anabaena variabilis TaxID=264691 RepID=Q3M4F5_TRIV2|nr:MULTISPECIES: hypothetical protein [Nostocaceae]ABA24131.1 conserved hypothetical protein [Trichormus variabilis ATCC 29413]MBC1215214.1 hypothetical protein [Trichormus variabilis ARAD]MBC1254935.1 hypothetical protein [Trichormus variabilis V5]MBC1266270.1 hypothetical protein [Trichormus variabilis FSR]MBC1302009.1 hypothetical protein [Trichormus variabilis N2B]